MKSWVFKFERENKSPEGKKVAEYFDRYNSTEGAAKVAFMTEARDYAASLGLDWWRMFYQHWRQQALMIVQNDYNIVLEEAIQAVVEIRKPIYGSWALARESLVPLERG